MPCDNVIYLLLFSGSQSNNGTDFPQKYFQLQTFNQKAFYIEINVVLKLVLTSIPVLSWNMESIWNPNNSLERFELLELCVEKDLKF
jgi:hypothetical protein